MPRIDMNFGFVKVTLEEYSFASPGQVLGSGGYGTAYVRKANPATVLKLTVDKLEVELATRLLENSNPAFVHVYAVRPIGEPYGWAGKRVTAIIRELVFPPGEIADKEYVQLYIAARNYIGRGPRDINQKNLGRRADGTLVILDLGQ
jgi:hypothetical protein